MQETKLAMAYSNITGYVKAKWRIIAVIWAVCFVVSQYLGSLFAQRMYVVRGVLTRVHRLNPIILLNYTFAGGGFGIGLIICLIGGCLITYVKIMADIQEVTKDPRGFEMSLNGTYGTATLMKGAERDSFIDRTEINETENNILGQDDDGKVLSVRNGYNNPALGPHKLVCGCSGSWKTSSQFLPDLMQTIQRGESMICTDPKGELRDLSYKMAETHGYIVKEINLIHPFLSDGCDFMALVDNYSDARSFTEIIMANTEGPLAKEDFWAKGERALICFGILYVKEAPEFEGKRTFAEVYKFLRSTSVEEMAEKVELLPESSFAKKQWDIFDGAPDQTKASIIIGVATRLGIMNDPAIQAMTSYDEIDVTLPGKEKCIYYVLMSDQKDDNNLIACIFFSFLFIKLVEYADARYSQRVEVPVNFLLDEMPNIGKIPNFPKKLSTIRSRGLRCTMCIQDNGQLMDMYPGNLWTNIIGNCDTRVLLGVNEPEVCAPYWAKASGEMTIRVDTERINRSIFQIYRLNPNLTKSTGDGKRQVFTADELMRMPNEYAVYYIRGHNVMKVKKFSYFNHPMYEDIEKENYFVHRPAWWEKELHSGKNTKEMDWFFKEQEKLQRLQKQMEHEKSEIEKKKKEEEIRKQTKLTRLKNEGQEAIDKADLSVKEQLGIFKITAKRKIRDIWGTLDRGWSFGRFKENIEDIMETYDEKKDDESMEEKGYIYSNDEETEEKKAVIKSFTKEDFNTKAPVKREEEKKEETEEETDSPKDKENKGGEENRNNKKLHDNIDKALNADEADDEPDDEDTPYRAVNSYDEEYNPSPIKWSESYDDDDEDISDSESTSSGGIIPGDEDPGDGEDTEDIPDFLKEDEIEDNEDVDPEADDYEEVIKDAETDLYNTSVEDTSDNSEPADESEENDADSWRRELERTQKQMLEKEEKRKNQINKAKKHSTAGL